MGTRHRTKHTISLEERLAQEVSAYVKRPGANRLGRPRRAAAKSPPKRDRRPSNQMDHVSRVAGAKVRPQFEAFKFALRVLSVFEPYLGQRFRGSNHIRRP